MNNQVNLKQDFYKKTVYLNDRPYNIFDIGDGGCHMLLVEEMDEEKLANITAHHQRRVIIVDISPSWGKRSTYNESYQVTLLAADIHLLLDIFWLESVSLECEIDYIDIQPIHDVVKMREQFALRDALIKRGLA